MAREPTTFAGYLRKHAPEVTSFSAAEILTKGGAHGTKGAAGYGLNTDPPPELWPNVIPLAKILQKLRDRVGAPIRLTNVYRAPAYNAAIGGAQNSQHMQFKAADITIGRGTPPDWAATLKAMRDAGEFVGGVGLYNTFVHVDVRGTVADWDDRTGANAGKRGSVLGSLEAAPVAPAPVPRPSEPVPAPPDVEPAPEQGKAPTGLVAWFLSLLAAVFGRRA